MKIVVVQLCFKTSSTNRPVYKSNGTTNKFTKTVVLLENSNSTKITDHENSNITTVFTKIVAVLKCYWK